MRQFVRVATAAACIVAAAATAAACSDNKDATPNAAPTVAFPSGSQTPGMSGASPMSMPGMTGTPATGGNAPAAPTGPDSVVIDNFAFAPATLTVPVGTTVTWTNQDEEPHTVASSNGTFHSPGMGAKATYSFTFTRAGTFDYICSIHPFMHATVVVTP
ncbi:cupredoxin domain-containing protein [Nocardia stercoris]|uniref:Plastocyanin n=1 Tax=Nocardia stercoris TaxID=2483361 RepID=A0A3M2L7Q1_9NOCA|nr:cupredoxin family copper-binding protein [Nocardia stercoris]RMI30558.1 plastocyanin [Nocardia stercoris]